jgi:DNA-binding GntR family transcriptional regulator
MPPETPRLSQAQRAYREIRRRILDNEMSPNAQYLERELAAALKMSRTPVREALIRLSEERLVEVRPRHGIRVLPIMVRDAQEIYELLAELEAMAARMLTKRGLSREDLARLEQAVAEMEAALARDDLIAWTRHDEIFHSLLTELSGNTRLSHFGGMLRGQAHRPRMQTLWLSRSRLAPIAIMPPSSRRSANVPKKRPPPSFAATASRPVRYC